MKYYDYLLKSPFLLAVVALITWCFIGVDIYRQIPIFCIIGLFITFKNKEIMTQGFKLQFAIYFAVLFAIRNFIVLYLGMHDPWGSIGIITSLPFIAIALPAQAIIALVGAYLSLLVANRVFYLLVKIAESKNWTRYISRPFIYLVERPKYIAIGLISILLLQFTYASIFYEKGRFELAGKSNRYNGEVSDIVPLPSNNAFVMTDKQYSIYDGTKRQFLSGGVFKQLYSKGTNTPQGIMLDNKKILILGEALTPQKKSIPIAIKTYAEIYDPLINSTVLTTENPTPDFTFASTKLLDGRVLIAGGSRGSNKIEIYTPKTSTFIHAGKLKEGRWCHSLAVLKNGNVLIIGGYANIAEIYDPKSMKIIKTFPYKTNAWGNATKTIPLEDGRVFIVYKGKQPNPKYGNMPISYTSIYNPETNTIQELELKYNNQKIDDFDATLLKNGKILITGGKVIRGRRAGYLVLNTAEVFDPKSNKFIPVQSKMKIPRYNHKTITLENGNVIIMGGVNNKQFNIEDIEMFTPAK